MARKAPVWLERTVVEAIHADLIREHGGSTGIRDGNLVDSALTRPRQKWHYDRDADFADLAAAYGYGLIKNHGFMDGNKRVGFMAIYVFLHLNKLELDADEAQAVDIIAGVADGSVSEEQLAAWIRERTVRRKR
jgi:death-on-curing protein